MNLCPKISVDSFILFIVCNIKYFISNVTSYSHYFFLNSTMCLNFRFYLKKLKYLYYNDKVMRWNIVLILSTSRKTKERFLRVDNKYSEHNHIVDALQIFANLT